MSSVQRTGARPGRLRRYPETVPDLRDAATISVAVGLVGVSFGALAPAAGLSPAMTVAMSLLVFAGGAQLLVTGVLAAGGGIWAAVVAGLVLNLRHLPFGLALARHVGGGRLRFPAAHVVTDESTAFVLARTDGSPGRARRAFWLLGALKFTLWQVGTVAGLLLGAMVPDPSALGLDAAFPAALLAMLAPMLHRPDAQRVGGAAAALSLVCSPLLPAGLPVLAGMLGVGAAGRLHPAPASDAVPAPATSGAATPERTHDPHGTSGEPA
ncbi:AzlC family ABC transporter permease [Pseudonocardia phyllosphaerae]|uniref:AzlC family ABC transporter permease n=1 Tax=Pseudonocardia phyllosphaerae TaxID=3390502 RepID=UPI003979F46E